MSEASDPKSMPGMTQHSCLIAEKFHRRPVRPVRGDLAPFRAPALFFGRRRARSTSQPSMAFAQSNGPNLVSSQRGVVPIPRIICLVVNPFLPPFPGSIRGGITCGHFRFRRIGRRLRAEINLLRLAFRVLVGQMPVNFPDQHSPILMPHPPRNRHKIDARHHAHGDEKVAAIVETEGGQNPRLPGPATDFPETISPLGPHRHVEAMGIARLSPGPGVSACP